LAEQIARSIQGRFLFKRQPEIKTIESIKYENEQLEAKREGEKWEIGEKNVFL
jgi:hypothetical protein